MKLFDNLIISPNSSEAGLLYGRLDNYFSEPWGEYDNDIASTLVSLRRNMTALDPFFEQISNSENWPTMMGAQSFELYSSEYILVRINLWFPQVATQEQNDQYRRYLSIDELHNHDFSFFTICLLGPGYKTHFYHDPAFTPNHNLGDIINLEDKGVLALSGERVLYVERDSDYHMQHWPDDFSVTLNVIPKNIPGKTNVQYILNADTFEVNTILAGDL
jgi:hypothetical protein